MALLCMWGFASGLFSIVNAKGSAGPVVVQQVYGLVRVVTGCCDWTIQLC